MMYHLSYLDIKHGIKRGGVKLTPPQRILVFKYPSRDRVKGGIYIHLQGEYVHITRLKGEFIYIYRLNIYTLHV